MAGTKHLIRYRFPGFRLRPFSRIAKGDRITQHVVRLASVYGDECHASGTAFFIAPRLLITARHVIEDHMEHHADVAEISDHRQGTTLFRDANFGIFVVQVMENGCPGGAIWVVEKIYTSMFSDIAYFVVAPHSLLAREYRFDLIGLNLFPPPEGEKVFAIGFHNSRAKVEKTSDDKLAIRWNDECSLTRGRVKTIYRERRDNTKLHFPCYETDLRFEGGMSGGPVFDDKGFVCGVICSSFSLLQDGDSSVAYVATLWPSMGTLIEYPVDNTDKLFLRPILELAKEETIVAFPWEAVHLEYDDEGVPARVGYQEVEVNPRRSIFSRIRSCFQYLFAKISEKM